MITVVDKNGVVYHAAALKFGCIRVLRRGDQMVRVSGLQATADWTVLTVTRPLTLTRVSTSKVTQQVPITKERTTTVDNTKTVTAFNTRTVENWRTVSRQIGVTYHRTKTKDRTVTRKNTSTRERTVTYQPPTVSVPNTRTVTRVYTLSREKTVTRDLTVTPWEKWRTVTRHLSTVTRPRTVTHLNTQTRNVPTRGFTVTRPTTQSIGQWTVTKPVTVTRGCERDIHDNFSRGNEYPLKFPYIHMQGSGSREIQLIGLKVRIVAPLPAFGQGWGEGWHIDDVRHTTPLCTDDQDVELVVSHLYASQVAAGGLAGVLLRVHVINNTKYMVVQQVDGTWTNALRILKIVNGAGTALAAKDNLSAFGHIRATVNGNTITGYVNNIQHAQTTDSDIWANRYTGIRMAAKCHETFGSGLHVFVYGDHFDAEDI